MIELQDQSKRPESNGPTLETDQNQATMKSEGDITGGKDLSQQENTRLVVPKPTVGLRTDSLFCTNEIKTSRYNWYNFLPIAIAIQFTKVANVSWLFVMILNMFPAIRINSPLVVAVVLGVILFIGVLKEGISDLSRHKQDKKTNGTPVIKMGHASPGNKNHRFNQTLKDVKVGDILFLEHGQQIPADCVILAVTNEQETDEGFIQTA